MRVQRIFAEIDGFSDEPDDLALFGGICLSFPCRRGGNFDGLWQIVNGEGLVGGAMGIRNRGVARSLFDETSASVADLSPRRSADIPAENEFAVSSVRCPTLAFDSVSRQCSWVDDISSDELKPSVAASRRTKSNT